MATIPVDAIRPANNRILSLDIIRGIAVMGILSVNIIDFAMNGAAYMNPTAYGGWHGENIFIWSLNMLFIDGKMRTLFSMLFGASMLLVIERAEASGGKAWTVHWRRNLTLLVLGFMHAILIWHGDILTMYAMTAFVAFLFWRSSLKKLIGWAIGLQIFSLILLSGVTYLYYHFDKAAHAPGATAEAIRQWNGMASQYVPSAEKFAKDAATQLGPWIGQVAQRASHVPDTIVSNILLLPETLSLMLIGMASYRSGLFTGEWDDARLKKLAVWSITLGLIAHGLLVYADISTAFYIPLMFGGFIVAVTPFRIAMALGYAALIVLASRRMGSLSLRIAAVGRAAFTNYIGTSLVMTFIFYGYGLGLYNQFDRFEAWLFAPAMWLLMLLWSKPWLEKYRYGPFEWVWRSLSRFQLQPMRKPILVS